MAALSLTLTQFQDNRNERTYALTGHTVQFPRMVLQRRKVAAGTPGSVAEDQVSVLYGTKDSSDVPIQARVLFTATIRRPVNGVGLDVTAALADFRAIVASDEFASIVSSQQWVKAG